MTNKQQSIRITVQPIRSYRKQSKKINTINTEDKQRKAYAKEILELLQNPLVTEVDMPDVFVSVLSSAALSLTK